MVVRIRSQKLSKPRYCDVPICLGRSTSETGICPQCYAKIPSHIRTWLRTRSHHLNSAGVGYTWREVAYSFWDDKAAFLRPDMRWWLTRVWDRKLKPLVFVMLNPSTADHRKDDATIRKCVGYAKRMGYGALLVLNLYAFRTTYPKELQTWLDESDGERRWDLRVTHFLKVATEKNPDAIVCAWGAHKCIGDWDQYLAEIIWHCGGNPKVIDFTADGYPRHPSRGAYNLNMTSLYEGKRYNGIKKKRRQGWPHAQAAKVLRRLPLVRA